MYNELISVDIKVSIWPNFDMILVGGDTLTNESIKVLVCTYLFLWWHSPLLVGAGIIDGVRLRHFHPTRSHRGSQRGTGSLVGLQFANAPFFAELAIGDLWSAPSRLHSICRLVSR